MAQKKNKKIQVNNSSKKATVKSKALKGSTTTKKAQAPVQTVKSKSNLKVSKTNSKQSKKIKLSIPKLKVNLSAKDQLDIKIGYPNLRIFYALIVKELRFFFVTPLLYVVATLYIFSVVIIFFGIFRYLEFGTTNLTSLFTASLFSFVFIVPALTMSSIAREKQTGTFEYILTKPFSIATFVLAKWLSVTIVITLISLTLIPILIYINSVSVLDQGQIIMQMVGIIATGSVIASLGICISAFYKSEIPAYLLTLVVAAFMVLSGSEIVRILPFEFDTFFNLFGIYSHYRSISRGVLDLRDLLYFVSLSLVLLSITSYVIASQKYPKSFSNIIKLQLSIVLLVIIFVSITYFGRVIPGRIDFTRNNLYTLSAISKDVIKNIDGNVEITLYTSNSLPVQFQEELRSVEDILQDYQSTSNGKLKSTIAYTDQSEEAETQAREIGLQEILFSVNSENSAEQTVGFFGLGIEYNDQVEVVQLTENITNNIEFAITSKIKKLTDTNKAVIGYVSNNTSRQRITDYRILNQSLEELYTVKNYTLNSDTLDQLQEYDVIVLAAPNLLFEEGIRSALLDYFNSGGAILLLTETIEIPEDTYVPVASEYSFGDLFQEYGVLAESNVVYDLKNNNQISAQDGIYVIPIDYPLWIKAESASVETPILKDITEVSFLWAGSLSISQNENAVVSPLLQTSKYANTQQSSNINISTSQTFTQLDTDGIQTIAASIEDVDSAGRAIVVADATFLVDSTTTTQNLTFALSSLEWLTNSTSLSEIQAKQRVATPLNLDETQKDELLSISIVVPLVVLSSCAAVIYWIRIKNIKRSL